MRAIIFSLVFFIGFGCMPNEVSDNEQTNQNSQDIQELVEEINRLRDQQGNPREENIVNSSYYTKEEMDKIIAEFQSDSIRRDQDLRRSYNEIKIALTNRLASLEGKMSAFTNKLDKIDQNVLSMENTYVSLEDFQALEREIQLELARKLDISKLQSLDLQDNPNADHTAVDLLAAEIQNLKEQQANFEINYKQYFQSAIKAWNEKLDLKLAAYSEENKEQVQTYIQNEVTRLITNIESLNERIDSIEKKNQQQQENLYIIAKEIQQLKESHNIFKGDVLKKYGKLDNLQEQTDFIYSELKKEKARLEKLMAQTTQATTSQNKVISSLVQKIKNLESNLEDYSTENNIGMPNYTDPQKLDQLREEVKANGQLLKALSNKVQTELNENIISDIIQKQFSPCHNEQGLKKNPYCYTLGTMILKLKGKFIDPFSFKRTHKDFIEYMRASDVKFKAIYANSSRMLIPDNANKAKYRKCEGNNDYWLLAPRTYWPRAVVLSLIFEGIENDINNKRAMNASAGSDINLKNVKAVDTISSWWRSECYNTALNDGEKSQSDHLYGAAFDPSMKNYDTIKFYQNYINKHFIENDTFGLTHPLRSSGLTYRTTLGASDRNASVNHNHNRFHFGIASEVKLNGRQVACDKWSYIVKNGKKTRSSKLGSCQGE